MTHADPTRLVREIVALMREHGWTYAKGDSFPWTRSGSDTFYGTQSAVGHALADAVEAEFAKGEEKPAERWGLWWVGTSRAPGSWAAARDCETSTKFVAQSYDTPVFNSRAEADEARWSRARDADEYEPRPLPADAVPVVLPQNREERAKLYTESAKVEEACGPTPAADAPAEVWCNVYEAYEGHRLTAWQTADIARKQSPFGHGNVAVHYVRADRVTIDGKRVDMKAMLDFTLKERNDVRARLAEVEKERDEARADEVAHSEAVTRAEAERDRIRGLYDFRGKRIESDAQTIGELRGQVARLQQNLQTVGDCADAWAKQLEDRDSRIAAAEKRAEEAEAKWLAFSTRLTETASATLRVLERERDEARAKVVELEEQLRIRRAAESFADAWEAPLKRAGYATFRIRKR